MHSFASSATPIHGPTRVSPAQFDPSDRTAMQQLTFEPGERQSRLGHHSIGAVIKLRGLFYSDMLLPRAFEPPSWVPPAAAGPPPSYWCPLMPIRIK